MIKGAKWPRKKLRLARAILLLSFRNGAKDFADSSEISQLNITGREYHHLFPDDFLKKKGFKESDSDIALNCALITWKTNRNISNKEPLKYLLDRSKANDLGEKTIRKRLQSHLIDYEKLNQGDYNKFIDKRAEDVMKAIKQVC